MTNYFNNQNLLEIIWKWKKHLIIVGILAILLSAFFSSASLSSPNINQLPGSIRVINIYAIQRRVSK